MWAPLTKCCFFQQRYPLGSAERGQMCHPAQEQRLSPGGRVGSRKPPCPARYVPGLAVPGHGAQPGVFLLRGDSPAVVGCTGWSAMGESTGPGSAACASVESRGDVALVLGPPCWPWTCKGKGKVVCNPACGHQRAAGQPLSLRWSLQRSREGTREMGPGVKETRSKGDRARYARDSRNVSCTVTGGSAMPTGAQQCPGSRRWHWKPKRILHPWVLGGHPVGSVPLEMGSSADGDVGDHVPAAGLAWHH